MQIKITLINKDSISFENIDFADFYKSLLSETPFLVFDNGVIAKDKILYAQIINERTEKDEK